MTHPRARIDTYVRKRVAAFAIPWRGIQVDTDLPLMHFWATPVQSVAEAESNSISVEQLLGVATKTAIDACGAAPDLRMYHEDTLLATIHGYVAGCASSLFRCYMHGR